MSRTLKMLRPVSHGFIKDWNMEMSNFRASFSLHSFGFMKDEKNGWKEENAADTGSIFLMDCVMY